MNVGEWILKRSLTYPDHPFVKEGQKEFNNFSFNHMVNQTARCLENLAVASGDRVAVLMDNSIDFLNLIFACAKTGAIFVPLNTQSAVEDLKYIIEDSSPKIMIYDRQSAKKANSLRELSKIDLIPLLPDPDYAGQSLEDLTKTFPGDEPATLEVDSRQPFIIMYMPSPSGQLRGVVLTHENILFGAIHSLHSYGINKTYKSLVVAPMYHIGPLTASVLCVVYGGGSLILENFYNPSRILSLITTENINFMFAVPVIYQMLSKAPEWEKADFSHVKYFLSGGAPMPVPLIEKYHREKGISFPQGYGMTEAGRLTSLDLEDSERKAGSVGKEVFHMFLKIVDGQDKEVEPGEIGEIIAKGPNIFQSYWNRPDETRTAFKNGWFYTGDLGRRDEQGFLYLEGRKIEMIISSGRNIYPIEVEKALLSYPDVKQAVAVGLPDPQKGQIVGAMICTKENNPISKEQLLSYLHNKLAAYKIPKSIIITDALPQNQAGTIDREMVRKALGTARG